jgi:hypothetical protein
MNALLALEEQRGHALESLKRRQQTIKKYFNKRDKYVDFKVDEKVLLWDSSHAERGTHSKFQKMWLGPFKIAYVLGTNSYLLKDMDERLFSYSANGSHLKHYVEPTWLLIVYFVSILFCTFFPCFCLIIVVVLFIIFLSILDFITFFVEVK